MPVKKQNLNGFTSPQRKASPLLTPSQTTEAAGVFDARLQKLAIFTTITPRYKREIAGEVLATYGIHPGCDGYGAFLNYLLNPLHTSNGIVGENASKLQAALRNRVLYALEHREMTSSLHDQIVHLAFEICTNFQNALTKMGNDWMVQPPKEWHPEPLPTEKKARVARVQDDKKVVAENQKQRSAFEEPIINAMMQSIQEKPQLQDSNTWMESKSRPIVLRRAVHGAVKHLCLLYAESLAPGALEKEIKKHDSLSEEYNDLSAELRRELEKIDERAEGKHETKDTVARTHSLRAQKDLRFQEMLIEMRSTIPKLIESRVQVHDEKCTELQNISRQRFEALLEDLVDAVRFIAEYMVEPTKRKDSRVGHNSKGTKKRKKKTGTPSTAKKIVSKRKA